MSVNCLGVDSKYLTLLIQVNVDALKVPSENPVWMEEIGTPSTLKLLQAKRGTTPRK